MLPIYGTAIKVIAGFYLGCTGFITEKGGYSDSFYVNLSCKYKVQNTYITDMFKAEIPLKDLQIVSTPRQ